MNLCSIMVAGIVTAIVVGCASTPPRSASDNWTALLQMVQRSATDDEIRQYFSENQTSYYNDRGVCISGQCPMDLLSADRFLTALHAATESFKKQVAVCKHDASCLASIKVLRDPESGGTATACLNDISYSDDQKKNWCFVDTKYSGGLRYQVIRQPELAASNDSWLADDLRIQLVTDLTAAATTANENAQAGLNASDAQATQKQKRIKEAWEHFRNADCATVYGYTVVQSLGNHAYEIEYPQAYYLEQHAVLRTHHTEIRQAGTIITGMYVKRGPRRKIPTKDGFSIEAYQLEESDLCKGLAEKAKVVDPSISGPLFGTGMK